MVWSALIDAGSSLLGGFLNRREDRKALERSDHWNQESLRLGRDQFERGIQTRVADATAAGVHPLFAMGAAGGSFSPSTFHSSGSGLGTGIANAGRALAGAVERRGSKAAARLVEAQTKAWEARAERDHLEGQAAASAMKRAEQEALAARTYALPGQGSIRRRELVPEAIEDAMALVTRPGRKGFVPSRTTTAEKIEEEYGDLAGMGYGVFRLLADSVDLLRERVHRSKGPRVRFRGWKKRARPGAASRRY